MNANNGINDITLDIFGQQGKQLKKILKYDFA